VFIQNDFVYEPSLVNSHDFRVRIKKTYIFEVDYYNTIMFSVKTLGSDRRVCSAFLIQTVMKI